MVLSGRWRLTTVPLRHSPSKKYFRHFRTAQMPNAPTERYLFSKKYRTQISSNYMKSCPPYQAEIYTWSSSIWALTCIGPSTRVLCKKSIRNLSCTNCSKDSSTCIRPKFCIEIWNLPIYYLPCSVNWKYVILDWQDIFNNLVKKDRKMCWLKELPQGGTGLLRFYLDRINMMKKLICGVLAASSHKCY